MRIDLIFPFAKVYNVHRVSVMQGQTFSFKIPVRYKVFSDNDEVLSIKKENELVTITTAELGRSTILILNDDLFLRGKLFIRVVPELEDPAGELGLYADAPVRK